jgi:spermidine synthase
VLVAVLPPTFRFTLICFLSGAAALLFETLWFRQAGILLGNSVWASSLVLASFMSGLALGNGLMIRYGETAPRPLRWYASFELAIGASGLALVWLLPALSPLLVPVFRPILDKPWLINPLRFAVAFLLLLIPSTAMGATLPVLVKGLMRHMPQFGPALGRLYGWNTLGAVLGAVAGELALVEALGVRGTGLFAAGLNATAALVAWGAPAAAHPAARGTSFAAPMAAPPAGETRAGLTREAVGLLAAAFLCGAIMLALEIIWFRFMLFFVHAMSTAFAIMLGVVLIGIAVGGLLGGLWLGRRPEVLRWVPVLALVNGLLCIGTYIALDPVLSAYKGKIIIKYLEILDVSVPLMLPVSLFSGVLFTLLGEAMHRAVGGAARPAGWLTLANTIGAALGSLAATLFLLPALGVERAFQALGGAYALVAAALLWTAPEPQRRDQALRAALPAAALILAVAFFPIGRLVERYLPYKFQMVHFFFKGAMPVAMREGVTESIVYFRRDLLGETVDFELLTNGYVVSDSSLVSHRYTMLFAYLPAAVHPGIRDVLVIGYGAGGTAKALSTLDSVERVDVADLSRDIIEMSALIYPDPAEHPLRDPRFHVQIEDGRYVLQTSGRRYDLITGEPPPPKTAGVVNLYTREYFELMRRRLAPGGLVSYWLPVHGLTERDSQAIARAFCDVFPDCTIWTGMDTEWIMLGSLEDRLEPVDESHLRALWNHPKAGPVLRDLGYETPAQMGAIFVADAEDVRAWAAGVPPLTDDRPKRLSNYFPMPQPLETVTWYEAMMDVRGTRQRYERSQLVKRLLPEPLRQEALEYFDEQEAINFAVLHSGSPDPKYYLHTAHQLLTGTQLRELPLWFLGSNAYLQRAARAARAKGLRHHILDFHLAARALADRDYTLAAEAYRSSMERGGNWLGLWHARVYALCLAGRTGEAQLLAQRRAALEGIQVGEQRFFGFLGEKFPGTTWPLPTK